MKLLNQQQVLDQFRQAARKKMDKDGDRLVATFFDRYLGAMPMAERRQGSTGGHLFEAWLTAAERSGAAKSGPRLAGVLARMNGYRSGDTTARKGSLGSVRKLLKRVHYHFHTGLPFIAKIERGQTIEVGDKSGNKGRKYARTIGRLYGRRRAGRNGMLMWVDGAGKHFAKFRTPAGPGDGVGAFADAKQAVAEQARTLGWVRK
jgi:hypothetical protein